MLAAGMAFFFISPAAATSLRPVRPARPSVPGSALSSRVREAGRLPDLAGRPIPFGTARFFGALSDRGLGSPAVGIAASPSGHGYWILTSNGRVFDFGQAEPHRSTSSGVDDHAVAIVATSNGGGYWVACSTGGVFTFGDAKFHGSANDRHLAGSIVGMAAEPDGGGYWLADSDGAVFNYGDARFYGAAIGEHLRDHIVAIAATPDGRGYWLVASGGGVFSYGDAHFYGAATGEHLRDDIVAVVVAPHGRGYWLVASGGGVFSYGDAHFYGAASAASAAGADPVVAAAAGPGAHGYWLLPSTPLGLPAPGAGFVAGHVTAIGDSVMLDAQPDLEADIPGIDVEAVVSRQWDDGIALAAQLKAQGRLGAIVIIDLGTNGPVTPEQFTEMMSVLSGASRVVFVTVHLPAYYSWSKSVNATLEEEVPKYPEDRLADFNKLADKNPQWFGPDGVHMPIGGTGAQAMAKLIKSQI